MPKLHYKQDNMPDVNIDLLVICLSKSFNPLTQVSKANMNNWHSRHFWMLAGVVEVQFSQNPDRTHIFSHVVCIWRLMGPMNTYIGKHTDNCCRCSMGQLCLSLPCSFSAHIKYTKTKCPFQQQQGGGVQLSPPKSQTKVCPCCLGQNMPFYS